MADIAIRVSNLSKLYRIGARQQRHDTLRDSIAALFDAPKRWFSRNGQAEREDTIWALKDVSFDVKHGEVVGIIGRNGAGKSTLLKILSRITKPTEGSVEIHGRVGSLLEVGTGFHPELTGRENIYLNGAILGMKRAEIERKFDEIVAFAEIEKFLDTPVKRYSSGMYVRLAFAVAAHLEPEILIVDEVLAVGDAQFQKKCLGKMGDVAKEGRTVLFVSHNMQAVSGLCSSGVLLDQGQTVLQDRIAKVIEIYLNANLRFNSEVCWPCQDDEFEREFRFCAVRIRAKDHSLASIVPLSEGFILELEYEIRRPLEDTNIAVILNNGHGECVLTSTDVDMNPKAILSRREPGRYLASVYVPSEYLRPGIYHIDLGASITNRKMLDHVPQAISLEIMDDGSVEMLIGQGRRGVIAPRLPWRVVYQPFTDSLVAQ